jgi:hypothetical protein
VAYVGQELTLGMVGDFRLLPGQSTTGRWNNGKFEIIEIKVGRT